MVGCYLSEECDDAVKAVDFVCGLDGDEAIKILIQSDLNQVVNLLKEADDAKKRIQKEVAEWQSKLDSVKNSLAVGNRGRIGRPFIGGGLGGGGGGQLSSLSSALGASSAVIGAILADQAQGESGLGQFESAKQLERDIAKFQSDI